LFVIFTAGLLFSCKSQSGDELLFQGIMKNRMSDLKYSKYTESKNGDSVKFVVADKEFFLQGKYSQIKDYKVVSLYQADNESGKYLTAIFANEEGVCQSVFENELEAGKLDTIIDLNKDNVNEIILQYYERNSDGYESRLGLYAKKGSLKYTKIGDIAPSYFRGSAYNNGFSTAELLQVNDYNLLFVNTQKSDPSENNLGNQKDSGFFYRVTTAGILEKLNADELVLTREPLLFKYQKDGLWGIYSRVGNGIVKKESHYLAGPVNLLTGLSKTKEILPAEYIEILAASEGLIPVQNKNHLAWGVINLNGDFVVNCMYNGISKFENGRAVVQIRGEADWRKAYQYVDTKGNELGSFFEKNPGMILFALKLCCRHLLSSISKG
jgi:hypothetical protein